MNFKIYLGMLLTLVPSPFRGATAAANDVSVMSGMPDIGT